MMPGFVAMIELSRVNFDHGDVARFCMVFQGTAEL